MQSDDARKLSIMVDYLFGRGVSAALPKSGVKLVLSRRSGRVKLVYYGERLFATVKPNGAMALTVYGATLLAGRQSFRRNCVVVDSEAAPFVRAGKSAFNKFVLEAGSNVRPRGEVAVLDPEGHVLAVGTAVVNGRFMRQFASGVAVKVREGARE